MKFSENGLMPIADYSRQYDFKNRGLDGFIIFVPNEIAMQSTVEALKGAGVRKMDCIENGNQVKMKGQIII